MQQVWAYNLCRIFSWPTSRRSQRASNAALITMALQLQSFAPHSIGSAPCTAARLTVIRLLSACTCDTRPAYSHACDTVSHHHSSNLTCEKLHQNHCHPVIQACMRSFLLSLEYIAQLPLGTGATTTSFTQLSKKNLSIARLQDGAAAISPSCKARVHHAYLSGNPCKVDHW